LVWFSINFVSSAHPTAITTATTPSIPTPTITGPAATGDAYYECVAGVVSQIRALKLEVVCGARILAKNLALSVQSWMLYRIPARLLPCIDTRLRACSKMMCVCALR
jgi:hypothetical protein